MRIGDDNLFEIGCRASCLTDRTVCLTSFPYSFFFFFFFNYYRRRIAERGQRQHGFDKSARAPYCADFVVLRYWRGLSGPADGR